MFAIQYGGSGGENETKGKREPRIHGKAEEIASNNLENRKWRALKEGRNDVWKCNIGGREILTPGEFNRRMINFHRCDRDDQLPCTIAAPFCDSIKIVIAAFTT